MADCEPSVSDWLAVGRDLQTPTVEGAARLRTITAALATASIAGMTPAQEGALLDVGLSAMSLLGLGCTVRAPWDVFGTADAPTNAEQALDMVAELARRDGCSPVEIVRRFFAGSNAARLLAPVFSPADRAAE